MTSRPLRQRRDRATYEVVGRGDLKNDPRFITRSTRVSDFATVSDLTESWTNTRTKDDVAWRMLAASVPRAPGATFPK